MRRCLVCDNKYFEGLMRHLKGKRFKGYGPLLTVVRRYMRIEIDAEA